jgi:hypothetical protein
LSPEVAVQRTNKKSGHILYSRGYNRAAIRRWNNTTEAMEECDAVRPTV